MAEGQNFRVQLLPATAQIVNLLFTVICNFSRFNEKGPNWISEFLMLHPTLDNVEAHLLPFGNAIRAAQAQRSGTKLGTVKGVLRVLNSQLAGMCSPNPGRLTVHAQVPVRCL